MEIVKLTPAREGKIKRDIEKVKKHSRVVLRICKDNIVEIIENKNKVRLDVIAVLGPARRFNRNWEEVILAEVGFRSTRPYNKVMGLDRTPDEKTIPKRRKWFSLSKEQYELIAPIVFKRIEGFALKKVLSWEKGPFSDDPFLIPSTWHFWTKRGKKFYSRVSWMARKRGIRFSVSLKDIFFIKDVYWAELNLNKDIKGGFLYGKGQINGLVNFIDKRINWYRSDRNYKGRKPFRELTGVKQVEKILQRPSLSQHLKIEVVRRLRDEKKNIFSEYIADMINWDGLESRESKLAKSVLANPKARLGNIQLRVTTGLETAKNYIVFEVYPQKK